VQASDSTAASELFFIRELIMAFKAVWDTLTKPEGAMIISGEMVPFNLAGLQTDDLEPTRTVAMIEVAGKNGERRGGRRRRRRVIRRGMRSE